MNPLSAATTLPLRVAGTALDLAVSTAALVVARLAAAQLDVFAPVHCDSCRETRSHISGEEVLTLLTDAEIACRRGGGQVFVGEPGLADALEVASC